MVVKSDAAETFEGSEKTDSGEVVYTFDEKTKSSGTGSTSTSLQKDRRKQKADTKYVKIHTIL